MNSALKSIQVDYEEPHFQRTQMILKSHPEVKTLFGYTPSTALYVVGLVALQIGMAWWLKDSSIWVILLGSYTIGALANHALWVLIHECTHNLVFKTSTANSWLQIFANLPIIFPSAISFRIYHIKHHLHQGDLERDADLPHPFEAKVVGNSSWRKALWLLFFFVGQSIRVPALKDIQFFNRWVFLNVLIELSFLTAVTYFFGAPALGYLFLSSCFSIGLHPVGARWIQEHYVVHENQETYSYYGPLNKVAFNVGYHNEHHDLMRVPWSRLPRLRSMAPEYYDTLHFHTSWTRLLIRFLLDPKLSLYSRVTRVKVRAEKPLAASSEGPVPPAPFLRQSELSAAGPVMLP